MNQKLDQKIREHGGSDGRDTKRMEPSLGFGAAALGTATLISALIMKRRFTNKTPQNLSAASKAHQGNEGLRLLLHTPLSADQSSRKGVNGTGTSKMVVTQIKYSNLASTGNLISEEKPIPQINGQEKPSTFGHQKTMSSADVSVSESPLSLDGYGKKWIELPLPLPQLNLKQNNAQKGAFKKYNIASKVSDIFETAHADHNNGDHIAEARKEDEDKQRETYEENKRNEISETVWAEYEQQSGSPLRQSLPEEAARVAVDKSKSIERTKDPSRESNAATVENSPMGFEKIKNCLDNSTGKTKEASKRIKKEASQFVRCRNNNVIDGGKSTNGSKGRSMMTLMLALGTSLTDSTKLMLVVILMLLLLLFLFTHQKTVDMSCHGASIP